MYVLNPNSAPEVITESKTLKVNETFTGAIPENSVFSGAEWSSSSAKATVTQQGLITAKETGSVTVTGYYTTPYKTPAKKYTVTIQPAVPTVQEETKSVEIGANFTAELPSTAGFSGAEWESTDPTKATVNTITGEVTPLAEGATDIIGYYTKPYKTPIKKIKLTVTNAAAKTTRIFD